MLKNFITGHLKEWYFKVFVSTNEFGKHQHSTAIPNKTSAGEIKQYRLYYKGIIHAFKHKNNSR